MALSSMTGFARSHGASGPYTFEWELKSVNARGFDLRVRLPQGFDELEAHAKKRAGEILSRGTVYANLNVKRTNAAATVRINEEVLSAVLKAASQIAGKVDAVAPSIDGLLGIKGVIEVAEPEGNVEEDKAARTAAAEAFDKALAELVDMRKREGTSLGQILTLAVGLPAAEGGQRAVGDVALGLAVPDEAHVGGAGDAPPQRLRPFELARRHRLASKGRCPAGRGVDVVEVGQGPLGGTVAGPRHEGRLTRGRRLDLRLGPARLVAGEVGRGVVACGRQLRHQV